MRLAVTERRALCHDTAGKQGMERVDAAVEREVCLRVCLDMEGARDADDGLSVHGIRECEVNFTADGFAVEVA